MYKLEEQHNIFKTSLKKQINVKLLKELIFRG